MINYQHKLSACVAHTPPTDRHTLNCLSRAHRQTSSRERHAKGSTENDGKPVKRACDFICVPIPTFSAPPYPLMKRFAGLAQDVREIRRDQLVRARSDQSSDANPVETCHRPLPLLPLPLPIRLTPCHHHNHHHHDFQAYRCYITTSMTISTDTAITTSTCSLASQRFDQCRRLGSGFAGFPR